ncbi:MAG: antibiotic biosynthesis monooxygenase [Cypionkella sp.]|uniref:antibiotic biosynthesis monooxygenase family protein n=1 Tax=Cypionkella sp. TaxID=2811411 RepID=UPI002AB9096A|nr:antibiotic biosynthesis monooxygenase [Cypionkella sp.]MDZ4309809.1 antibiotic biosynthesis monooxygenase [Cypionkella sp.]MDZ4394321.1 antibiotic biosynthesis monooxygenase [Cypionkella sp.]
MSTSLVETAEITVTDTVGFEAAVALARPHFLAAAGCLGLSLHRLIETPQVYRLVVIWRSLEYHTVTFRGSEGFQAWRTLAAPFFAHPPVVTHTTTINLD